MLKIAYYSADNPTFAVARLRFIDPVKLLGEDVEATHGVARTTVMHGGVSRVTNEIDVECARAADVIVVQRGFPRPETRDLLEELIASGKPLVYETDDDLRIVPPTKERTYADCVPYIEKFARAASLVTVSTPHLAERFRSLNPNTLVLPNCLPYWLFSRGESSAASSGRLTIGFCGSNTHEVDLQEVEDALIEVNRRHPGLRLLFMGCITDRLFALPSASFFEYNGEYVRWPRRLASASIDIAIVPLVDSEFNRCKSHIKFLELGYMGIPGVYSNVAAYRDSVENGVTGLLVSADSAAWIDALERLIADETMRKRIGENARKAVMAKHLLETHCGRWLEAYRSLL